MPTTVFQGSEQTEKYTPEQIIAKGEGTVFRGAPNDGVIAGPHDSPQLKEALNP